MILNFKLSGGSGALVRGSSKMKKILATCLGLAYGVLLPACASVPDDATQQVVNVYTHRHYDTDQQLFQRFQEETGIQVRVVSAGADELINRLETEGKDSPADVLITVDAGRLHRAKSKGLLQPVDSAVLSANIPDHLRDPEGEWFGLTQRARIIAYAKERVDPAELSTYEGLTDAKWKGKILIRSSGNIYNQSLLSSILAAHGPQETKSWAEGVVANMAREPQGNDRGQVKAVADGIGDLAIVNTYYLGRLLTSDNPEERRAGESVGVFFPNQAGRGAHVNVSGAGVCRHAKNRENAVRFIEFLSQDEAQGTFAQANFEYPVKPGVEWSEILQGWGQFKSDALNLAQLGELNAEAVKIFDRVGWQ